MENLGRPRISRPTIQFSVSRPLIQSVSHSSQAEVQKLWENSSEFRIQFERIGEELLSLMTHYCGGNWTETEIRIYLIPPGSRMPSLSDPLILKYRPDHGVTMFLLIHELVHRYIQYSNDFRQHPMASLSNTVLEALVNLVTLQVFGDIFGQEKGNQTFEQLALIVNTVNMTHVTEWMRKFKDAWDLNNEPLLVFLGKNPRLDQMGVDSKASPDE